MTYSIEIHDDQYISVLHEGVFSGRELFAARMEFSELAKATGVRRILADVTNTAGTLPTAEAYEFASSHREYLPMNMKIAVVIKPDQEVDAQFTEDVANNRGTNMKLFTDKATAIGWLLQTEK